jgi:molybdopterin molybdotransferase
MLPEGADAVIPFEEAQGDGEHLSIPYPVRPGTYVRKRGEIVKAGGTVAWKGDLATPGLVGMLAALGIRKARVSRRVRVGIASTGNEVVGRGRSPGVWQIHDSNSLMLAALAQDLGAAVVSLGIAGDSDDDIECRLRAGEKCDIVILTGGSSEGASDLVPGALTKHSCRLLIRGVNLRPGKHVVFAKKGRRVFFGLPGRPGGCFGLFHLLVRPALLAMMGCAVPVPAALRAVWCGGMLKRPQADTVIPARLGTGSEVRPVGDRGTGDLGTVARSNCLVVIEAGKDPLRKGDLLKAFPVRLP